VEGPHDKVVLFIEVEDMEAPMSIPAQYPGIPSLAYLGGHSLAELLTVERAATAEALRRAGRPNATFVMPRIGAEELGQLLMLLQIATVFGGALYDVDPLNQPGVELGKQLTYGLMGREGADDPEIPDRDPRWIV
jgi:glucose-6-phosphate isomerase